MKDWLIIFCLALAAGLLSGCTTPGKIQPNELSPFVSDGCSHYPDGTPSQPKKWRDCCISHDHLYWSGGTRMQKAHADMALKQCISERTGNSLLQRIHAKIVWLGVRVGGSALLPTYFRWGFGWPYYRGYKSISAEEQATIEQLGKTKTPDANIR